MPLRSQLLQGDPLLEAAATLPSGHITPGSSGRHVAKIQTALNLLENAGLATDGVYGQKTAAAVLRYKQKRNIINRAYQSVADNIVGVMTITTLDDELANFNPIPKVDPVVLIGKPSFGVRPAATRLALNVNLNDLSPSTTLVTTAAVVRGNPYVSREAKDVGLPPSVPPRKSYAVQVSVVPPLANGDVVDISIINSSAQNGSATVSPSQITKTATVIVTGGQQTEPGNAGKLQIQASFKGTIKAVSAGFSVCAHPLNLRSKLLEKGLAKDFKDGGDVFTEITAGGIVHETLESDSGVFDDLDKGEWSEVVEMLQRPTPPWPLGSGVVNNSGFRPIKPPDGTIIGDQHLDNRPGPGPAAVAERLQAHMFNCFRCGAKEVAVPNSGFSITHNVTDPQKNGKFKYQFKKTPTDVGIKVPSGKSIKTNKADCPEVRGKIHDL